MGKYGIISLKKNIRRFDFMCKVCELGKVVVNLCLYNGFNIDTAKLQKLLVLMHGIHMVKYNEPLFPENVLVWDCGVAIEEVDTQFREFGGGFTTKFSAKLAVLNSEAQVIEEMLVKHGNKDVFELNNDKRLKYLKDKFHIPKKSVLVGNDEIRKVFMNHDL